MVDERFGIVWNPSKTTREELEEAAVPVLGSISWHETSEDDPGRGAAGEALAAGADVVVAAGGDGTVRAVAERLAEDDAAADLAIVPLGTGNLLARNLGVPVGDLPGAFTRAVEGDPREIDLGWVEGQVEGVAIRKAFTVIAGFGIDAHMIDETDDDLKSKVGWLAYIESLGRALKASDVVDLELVLDGGTPERTSGHTLMIGNCGTLQGGLSLLPDADPADGELDLLLLEAEGVGQWLDTLRSYVWDNGLRRLVGDQGEVQSADTVTHARVRSLGVSLSRPRLLQVDGDGLGATSAFTIETQPAAVRVR